MGSDYKLKNNVLFPPFDVFVEFFSQQDQKLPKFQFYISCKHSYQANFMETPQTEGDFSPQIRCHLLSSVTKTKISSSDCDKMCPIHKKAHPLRKCIFWEKSSEECKAFLKENGFCFRCCKVHVKCADCGSENHDTAFHPEPAPMTNDINPHSENGGEGDCASAISSHFTQVCGL